MERFHPFCSQQAKEQFIEAYNLKAKQWPVASEAMMVNTKYGETYVRVSGNDNASPLVLLHGDTENSLSWIPQIEALSKSFRVYAVDHIFDNGRSIYTRKLNTITDHLEWLDDVFDGLGLSQNINLVGFSYGGWLAAMYTLKRQGRLSKTVLIIPSSTVLQPNVSYLALAIVTHFFPFPFLVKRLVRWERKGLLALGEKGERISNEMIEELLLAVKCFKKRKVVNPSVLTDSDWKSIKIPLLFMVGENEVLYDASRAVSRLNSIAPEVKTKIIKHASHDIAISQASKVNDEILDFLL